MSVSRKTARLLPSGLVVDAVTVGPDARPSENTVAGQLIRIL